MLDYAKQLVRATEPQELAQVQTDFVNRQSQKVADQARELGQAIMQHANDMAKTTTQGDAIRSMSMCALPEAEGSATAVQAPPVQVLARGTSKDRPPKPDQRYSTRAFRP